MDKQPDSALLDANEVARRLKVSRPYAYKLERLGLLRSVAWEVNGRRTIRFLAEDVTAFIQQHRAV
jgi:excisionase family DNA binding protein